MIIKQQINNYRMVIVNSISAVLSCSQRLLNGKTYVLCGSTAMHASSICILPKDVCHKAEFSTFDSLIVWRNIPCVKGKEHYQIL